MTETETRGESVLSIQHLNSEEHFDRICAAVCPMFHDSRSSLVDFKQNSFLLFIVLNRYYLHRLCSQIISPIGIGLLLSIFLLLSVLQDSFWSFYLLISLDIDTMSSCV